MSKGTPSRGKHSKGQSHIPCRRCGNHSYHIRKEKCASCGYGDTAKIRNPTWNNRR